ncbi:hypothetical protein PUR50_31020, partial [Enterobacter hormaechei subsp. steigerwaltii]|nr:hypothetical protein [Enterobacter hormaechei subsp. steigerwaltii]
MPQAFFNHPHKDSVRLFFQALFIAHGERDIDALVEQARERVIKTGELTRTEVDELTRAVRRDLEEFAM